MPEQNELTIEMEPVRGGQEFGALQPEPQAVSGVTDEQLRLAAEFEQRFGETARVTAKQALESNPELANQFLQRAADRADNDPREDVKREALRADHSRRQEWNALIAGGGAKEAIVFSAEQISDTEVVAKETRLFMKNGGWEIKSSKDLGTVTSIEEAQELFKETPAAGLTRGEIVAEARGLRSGLGDLAADLETAGERERTDIRDQMKPLAIRENELRDEYLRREREQTQAVSEAWLGYESMRIRQQASTSVFNTTEEAALAAAYYNGRRETFNSARETFIGANPEMADRVPTAISVEDIQVRTREQVLETPSMEISA